MRTQTTSLGRLGSLAAACVVTGIGLLCALPAQAHFKLQEPAVYSVMDGAGSPQKSPPCGQDDGTPAFQATGAVTSYQSGGMLNVTILETVDHPGHYRVAIAKDLAALSAIPEPTVTPGAQACGTAPIDPNPTLPVLADGLFVHTSSFNQMPQTAQIQLPAGYTCENCLLQVIEFMSAHPLNNPGGCYYHHCATVNITATPMPDDGTPSIADMSLSQMVPAMASGCSYAPTPTQSLPPLAPLSLLGLFGLLAYRRRRATAI